MTGSRCVCGSPLPVHLAAVGLTAHVCSCTRRYRVKGGVFVEDGREANPFAGTGLLAYSWEHQGRRYSVQRGEDGRAALLADGELQADPSPALDELLLVAEARREAEWALETAGAARRAGACPALRIRPRLRRERAAHRRGPGGAARVPRRHGGAPRPGKRHPIRDPDRRGRRGPAVSPAPWTYTAEAPPAGPGWYYVAILGDRRAGSGYWTGKGWDGLDDGEAASVYAYAPLSHGEAPSAPPEPAEILSRAAAPQAAAGCRALEVAS